MLAEQFITAAAAARSAKALDEIARLSWRALAEAQINETAAEAISTAVEARRMAWKAQTPLSASKPSSASRRPPRPQSPDRARSIERRRRLAASGIVPGRIAAAFTQGEVAALAVIGRQVQQQGTCSLAVDAIAALAGVCRTTVQNALRQARALGLVHVRERRRKGLPNLPNIVTVAEKEWTTWLKIGGRWAGFKNTSSTNNRFSYPAEKSKKHADCGEKAAKRMSHAGADSRFHGMFSASNHQSGRQPCTTITKAASSA